jgi:hypothetical protein
MHHVRINIKQNKLQAVIIYRLGKPSGNLSADAA